MSIFDFLFKKKENKNLANFDVETNSLYTEEYINLINSRPIFSDYIGRDYDTPAYTDTFETGTNYNLRELLLLIWWGKTKNGRSETVTIPKYFFNKYNLNAPKLTHSFFKENLLMKSDGKIKLTNSGQNLFNEFKDLWEIHSLKNYPSCLDLDFENWDKDKFYINYYQNLIRYEQASANHSEKFLKYFSKQDPDSIKDIGNQRDYHTHAIYTSRARATDALEKLNILLDKQKHYLE